MARKKHGPPHEEAEGEAWLLPYSDLMTLLLALFMALFGMASMDKGKAAAVGASFGRAFGILPGGGNSIFYGLGPAIVATNGGESAEDAGNGAYFAENEALTAVQRNLENYIKENHIETQINTAMTEEGLMIRIKEQALFPSGSAELVAESQRLGPVVAGLLAAIPENVIISGHTDNVPINTEQYPSNWELSSARAMNFMRYLLSVNSNLNPARFSAIGFAEYRPAATNDTEEGRARNRRVEILIARNFKLAEGTLVAK
ncbi:MAG: OmpA family protein [Schwartzia sp.]|nr:OmpA family protein [Schwartzia sp. (in: firmicutes)]